MKASDNPILFEGILHKMASQFGSPILYTLESNNSAVSLNPLIGKSIQLEFLQKIFCILCGRATKKSFGEGFCYPCFIKSPENSECIIRPELCRAHLGEGRDVEWEKRNHLQEHVVYLAVSGGTKVGVTRATQIPTRWIDQGASEAIILAKTPNRYLAGCIEVALKNHLSDKTSWQKMLKFESVEVHLEEVKEKCKDWLPKELIPYFYPHSQVTLLQYPVHKIPTKVLSVNLEKTPAIQGVLNGIRGQYWIYEDFRVLNIRKHSGFLCRLTELRL